MEHFKSLEGQAALDAQQGTQDAIDGAFKNARSALKTPEQQYRFDTIARTYQQRYFAGQISSHADEAAKAFAHENNANSIQNALTMVTNAPDDVGTVTAAMSDARQATYRDLQIEGMANDPAAVQAAFQRADAAVVKTRLQTIAVKDPARAAGLVDNFQNMLGPDYAQLANEFRTRAAGQVGNSAGEAAYSGAAAQPAGAAATDAVALIRQQEGFKAAAYWDKSAYRTGYGSDTITNPDGSFQPVGRDTVVDQAGAERDLERRVGQTQAKLVGEIGQPAWNAMSPAMQASLTSVAYNYGTLPQTVATAAQSGDPTAVAQAIYALSSDNGGINARRRAEEAANALRGGGTATTPAQMPQAPTGAPGAAASPYGTLTPMLPAGGAPANENAPAAAPSPAPVAPPPLAQTPEEKLSIAYQQLEANPRLANDPQAMEAAKRRVNELYQMDTIAAGATEKARKEASDQAQNKYTAQILTGNIGPDLVQEIARDPALAPEARMSLGNAAIKELADANGGDVRTFGPAFSSAYQRIVAPAGDPGRISDPIQLLRMVGPGGLTLAGAQKLQQVMTSSQRSVDDAAVNRAKSGLLTYAHSIMSFEEPLTGGPADQFRLKYPKGEAAFNSQFVPRYEASFDAWIKAGKDPWAPDGPLSRGYIDKLANDILPKSQVDADRINATGQQPAPQAGEGPMPPPPPDADPNAWQSVIATPPVHADGTPWTYQNWAAAVTYLRAHPDMAKDFDQKFANHGVTAADIFGVLPPPTGNMTGLRQAVQPQAPAGP